MRAAVAPRTHSLGYPRFGAKRELKKALEAYWAGRLGRTELERVAADLRQRHWIAQRDAGLDLVPSNDFSLYDHVLDTTCLVGNVPPRFGWRGGDVDLDTRFAIARGLRPAAHAGTDPIEKHAACDCGPAASSAGGGTVPVHACDMTKWFDTNYHYLVPEFRADTRFALSSGKPFDEFREALALGLRTKPVLLGPVTYLSLGKVVGPHAAGFDRFDLLEHLLPVYVQVLQQLAALGAEWAQLDEPIGALDLTPRQRAALTATYAVLAAAEPRLRLLVATYFGGLHDNLRTFAALPVHALHVDVVRDSQGPATVLEELPAEKILSLGVVDGRNIWRNDLTASLAQVRQAIARRGAERVWVAPSCSLLHVPVSLRHETALDPELRTWLAFADEKLAEVVALREIVRGTADPTVLASNRAVLESRRNNVRLERPDVRRRLAAVTPDALERRSEFSTRQRKQGERFQLPAYPTTTIGSFPQTDAVRAARAKWKRGEWTAAQYETFLEAETTACVRFQEEVGLDVLVHGEFERNDMVEYFGEQLDGFAFTENGWVQSYGSRGVKPPILFGDVARARPMTVRWAKFAQALTPLPMKGMLTGPITVLQWSFVRDDQPRWDTARQIALALREEVLDLEHAGIGIIQVDEPALREGLPLRRDQWRDYLGWAVDAFRLATAGVRDETQIHTHMCYAEFNDIIEAIARLDADVITIETARSNMELLEAFESFRYPNEIGPGVWDIHSPRVPDVAEMSRLLERAATVLPPENLWVNPDCGLKTRGWPEVKAALHNLVEAARGRREVMTRQAATP